MALLFMDSFDHYVTADVGEKWSVTAGTPVITAGLGRRSSAALVLAGSHTVSKTVAPSGSIACGGLAVMFTALTTPRTFLSLINGVTPQVAIAYLADGTLQVYRGIDVGSTLPAGGVLLGTTTVAIALNTFAYLEWAVALHDSAGTLDLRINGVSVAPFPLTGLDTNNGAGNAWTALRIGGTSTSLNLRVDDLYLSDGSGAAPWNGLLGDVRVDARMPTAAGATTGWTPLAGANWDAVDDAAPDDDTTYTAAATAGLTDTFVTQDAPVVGAAIYGVQHCLSAKKMDAGAASIAGVVRHAGTDYVGANLNPGTTYAFNLSIAATNPGTGAAWTEADFNAAEFGYKRTV